MVHDEIASTKSTIDYELTKCRTKNRNQAVTYKSYCETPENIVTV